MTYLVSNLPDAYLQEIAGYFSTQHPPYPAPQAVQVPAAVLERGRLLATQGDASRNIPACAACHGEMLTGVAPAVPGLLGLPRDYLNAQFGAWRIGARHAAAPDCMADVTRRSSVEDSQCGRRLPRLARRAGRCSARDRSLQKATARLRQHGAIKRRAVKRAIAACWSAVALVAGASAFILIGPREHADIEPPGIAEPADAQLARGAISRAPAIAWAATPRAAACRTPADAQSKRRSALSMRPISRRTRRRVSALDGGRFLARAARRQIERRHAALSGVSVSELHERVTRADADALFAYLRTLAPVAQAQSRARAALSVQQAQAARRLAHAVFQAGRVQAGCRSRCRMEPRRLSRAGSRPLQRVPQPAATRWARSSLKADCRAA